MRRIQLFAVALMLTLSASAQDRLATSGHYGSIAITDKYHKTVDDMLGITNYSAEWAYLSRPSFEPEYSVVFIESNYGLELISYTPKVNLWYAGNDRNNVEIDKKTLRINRDQANQLGGLFRLAVESSTYLPGDLSYYENLDVDGENDVMIISGGLDGTTYNFISQGRSASCWSPREGTCLALVKIGDMLYQAVQESDIKKVDTAVKLAEDVKKELFKLVPAGYPNYLKVMAKRPSTKVRYNDTESTRMYLTKDTDGYTLTMGDRIVKGDKQLILSLIKDYRSNSLMIKDNGMMLWNDACDFATAQNDKFEGRTCVLTNVSSNSYWKERGIQDLLTVLPTKCTPGDKSLKLKDKVLMMNAAFTSDLEKNGNVTINPQSQMTLNTNLFNVFEVITNSNETILLYTSSSNNYMDLVLKADGKEYHTTKDQGMEDWYSVMPSLNIPGYSMPYSKVFSAHFPALPKGASDIRILEHGRILVEGLNLSSEPAKDSAPEFKTIGYYYSDNGWAHSIDNETGIETIDTPMVVVKSITCFKDKTVLTMTQHDRGFGQAFSMSNVKFQLNGGRELLLIEKENTSPKGVNADYDFTMEFEPMTKAEINAMEKKIKKTTRKDLPDIRKNAISLIGKYQEAGPIPESALFRLSGHEANSIRARFSQDPIVIVFDVYPSK